MTINNEIWRPVVGYESRYEVSNLGRVKRLARTVKRTTKGTLRYKEKIAHTFSRRNDYLSVTLVKDKVAKTVLVHRLVAMAFIENLNNKPIVNHINSIKKDNRVENLEWCNHSENAVHFFNQGYFQPQRKFSDEEVRDIFDKHKKGISQAQIGREKKVSRKLIHAIIKRVKYKRVIIND